MIRPHLSRRRAIRAGIAAVVLLLALGSGCRRSSQSGDAPGVQMNEVMAKSATLEVTDEVGQKFRVGWVELRNPNSSTVSLEGYTLSDNYGKPDKYRFPPELLGPGEFLLVFLTNPESCKQDCQVALEECRVDAGDDAALAACETAYQECTAGCSPVGRVSGFNLNPDEETLFLFSDGGRHLVSRAGLKDQPPDVAYGIDPESGKYGILYSPTPRAPNHSLNLKPPRFRSTPVEGPSKNLEPVSVYFTLDHDVAGGNLEVTLEYADVAQCDFTGSIPFVSGAPPQPDGEPTVGVDSTRLDLSGAAVNVVVTSAAYKAELPAAPCNTLRIYRVRAWDSLGAAESVNCFTYCQEKPTLVVNEYQPRNQQYHFVYAKSDGTLNEVTPDWIEIYNYGDAPVDLSQVGLIGKNSLEEGKFDSWLFGREGGVTEPLQPKSYLWVLADNDGGDRRNEYHLKVGDTVDTSRTFYSTRFDLDPNNQPPDQFALVTSAGTKMDVVVLDFSASGGDIAANKSVGRFEEEGTTPNALHPGTITDCPTPGSPNVKICEESPSFAQAVRREIPGGGMCPAPAEPVILRTQVNFDTDTVDAADRRVEFRFAVNGNEQTAVPLVELSPGQSSAAPASTLYDVTAAVPGQEAGAWVVFSFLAEDRRLERMGDPQIDGGPVLLDGTSAPTLSFSYVAGFSPPPDAPVINEVLPQNTSVVPPPFVNAPSRTEYPDYIEIYNPKQVPLDLGGYSLTDESPTEGRAKLWSFPAEISVVPPGGFLTVYFGPPPDPLPENVPPYIEVTGFNLACKDALYLVAPDDPLLGANCLLDSVSWDLYVSTEQGFFCKANQSIGRVCDGNKAGGAPQLAEATPGAKNVLPPIFYGAYHKSVFPDREENACVPVRALVGLNAIFFVDSNVKSIYGDSPVSRASFFVDRGDGQEEEIPAQGSSFPSCDKPAALCVDPPPSYGNLAIAAELEGPHGPITRYRVLVTDSCGGTTEAGPFSFASAEAEHPSVTINEINRSYPIPGGPKRPWIELFNGGATEVDLSGMFLSDDPVSPRKAPLPSGARIPAGSVLLVITTGESFDSFVSVDLGWVRQKGSLYLIDSLERGSCVVDEFAFDFTGLATDVSLGRDPDGDPNIAPLTTPSPGRRNSIPPLSFVRGDANTDLRVNILDMIKLVGIIFRGDTAVPPCEDALDANDDGDVNVLDSITLTKLLSGELSTLPPPFPDPGPDPTPDDLPPCTQ